MPFNEGSNPYERIIPEGEAEGGVPGKVSPQAEGNRALAERAKRALDPAVRVGITASPDNPPTIHPPEPRPMTKLEQRIADAKK